MKAGAELFTCTELVEIVGKLKPGATAFMVLDDVTGELDEKLNAGAADTCTVAIPNLTEAAPLVGNLESNSGFASGVVLGTGFATSAGEEIEVVENELWTVDFKKLDVETATVLTTDGEEKFNAEVVGCGTASFTLLTGKVKAGIDVDGATLILDSESFNNELLTETDSSDVGAIVVSDLKHIPKINQKKSY